MEVVETLAATPQNTLEGVHNLSLLQLGMMASKARFPCFICQASQTCGFGIPQCYQGHNLRALKRKQLHSGLSIDPSSYSFLSCQRMKTRTHAFVFPLTSVFVSFLNSASFDSEGGKSCFTTLISSWIEVTQMLLVNVHSLFYFKHM